MPAVLIVGDDEIIAGGMVQHLEAAGFDTSAASSGEQSLARLRFDQPDVCVLDLMLPRIDGWRIIETVRGEGIGTRRSSSSAPAAPRRTAFAPLSSAPTTTSSSHLPWPSSSRAFARRQARRSRRDSRPR
jgi:CheY-like chemotaxis protein